MPQLPKITKNQFKKLFKIFSLILLLDYPILPFLSSIGGDIKCDDYDILTCISISLFFILIVAFFWSMIWFMSYIAFFMEDYRSKDFKNKMSPPIYSYVKYIQNSYRDKLIQSLVMKLILILLCVGVFYLFMYEVFNIFNEK